MNAQPRLEIFKRFMSYAAMSSLMLFAAADAFIASRKLVISASAALCVVGTLAVGLTMYGLAYRSMIKTQRNRRWLFDTATIATVLTALLTSITIARTEALQIALLGLAITYSMLRVIVVEHSMRAPIT